MKYLSSGSANITRKSEHSAPLSLLRNLKTSASIKTILKTNTDGFDPSLWWNKDYDTTQLRASFRCLRASDNSWKILRPIELCQLLPASAKKHFNDKASSVFQNCCVTWISMRFWCSCGRGPAPMWGLRQTIKENCGWLTGSLTSATARETAAVVWRRGWSPKNVLISVRKSAKFEITVDSLFLLRPS